MIPGLSDTATLAVTFVLFLTAAAAGAWRREWREVAALVMTVLMFAALPSMIALVDTGEPGILNEECGQ